MASNDEQIPEFVRDPHGYAEETNRLAEELQDYIFPPWRWPGFYKRRRVVEARLANLRALSEWIEESESESRRGES